MAGGSVDLAILDISVLWLTVSNAAVKSTSTQTVRWGGFFWLIYHWNFVTSCKTTLFYIICFSNEDDDVVILDDAGQSSEKCWMRAKMLKFKENYRPAYYGTWRKTSKIIKARAPLRKDTSLFDYDVSDFINLIMYLFLI